MILKKDVLYISFHKPKSLLGYLISLRTLGKYSHVEFILNDYVYLANPGGIKKKLYKTNENTDIFKLHEHIQIPIVLEEFYKLNGKGYDYLAIFLSQLLEIGIEHEDKFFCSELCLYLINKGLDESLTYKLKELKPSKFSPSKLFKYLKFMELLEDVKVSEI